MGIYLANMKIPTSGELLVIIAPNGEVKYKKSVASMWDRTTAVSIPEPHGRLIDADMLDVIGYCGTPQGCEDTFDSGVMWLAEQIDELPTIIQESEEGET